MFDIPTLLVLVPAMPLLAAVVTAVLGPRVFRRASHGPVVAGVGLSCLAAVALLFQVVDGAHKAEAAGEQIGFERTVTVWTWADVGGAYEHEGVEGPTQTAARDFQIDVTLRADPLTAVMLVTVTFISFLIAIYSIGYMHGDPGYWRFFSYIALFVFSMTMLVSVSNFVLLYVFWEAVGLCSYLLIGFWYQKPEAAAAGKKAFLVNRVGDFGFALGVFLIWTTYGTLNFHGDWGIFGPERLAGGAAYYVGGGVGTAICLLLMLGACGKSAQLPLHVWLPDAMEGPTPVSALIHAATMVTAGVYMVARCTPLFAASVDAQQAVALIGGLTAFVAAVIALTQTDLKRILAYSTISQLGYMFLGLGAGTLLGISAGMFHLVTHAFFKALLFLGAGSVMHAMGGVIDVRRFGGLRRRMPTTCWTFLIGCLALAGFPLLSGFFSKDDILAAVYERASEGSAARFYHLLYLAGTVTALLTAFYTFRAYFLTFHGEERIPHEAGDHAHESPLSMTGPLAILAAGSAVLGGVFWLTGGLGHFLAQTPSLAYVAQHVAAHGGTHGGEEAIHWQVMITSSIVAIAGIGLAMVLYPGRPKLVESLARMADTFALYRLSHGKFFVDQAYYILIVLPLQGIAWLCYWFDRTVIDGLVDLVGLLPKSVGATLRPAQGGMVQFYALAMALGLLALIGALLL